MPAMTTETLSLFDPLPGTSPEAEQAATRAPQSFAQSFPQSEPQTDPHLRAARRLSRQIRRTVDGSPQQTRAAHLICRHLVAMLHADRARPEGSNHADP
jgi:hypothetical protein